MSKVPLTLDDLRGLRKLSATNGTEGAMCDILMEWAEAAVTEVAALRPDAVRYRKLRKCFWHDSPLAVVRDPKNAVKLGYDCPSEARLDEMVDQLPE